MSKFCRNCGKENLDQAGFCTACGTKMEEIKSGVVKTDGIKVSGIKQIIVKNKVVLLIAVVVLAAMFIFFGRSSYKDPIKNFEEGINKGDTDIFQAAFLPYINSDYGFDETDDEDFKNEFKDISVDIKITDKEHFKGDDIDGIISEMIDEYYDISADDCYIVTIEAKYNYDGEKKTREIDNILILKVDGDWYIANTDIFNGL